MCPNHCKNDDLQKLKGYLQLSTGHLFSYIFHLDYHDTLRANILSLRQSDVCRGLLAEVISECCASKLSYGQLGRMAVTILGSGKLRTELYQQVVKRCAGNALWKAFFELVYLNLGLDSQQGMAPHIREKEVIPVSLVLKFQEVLMDTYSANWRADDYMSPTCFLYLIERLLIILSSFRNYVFTTKSAFVEWIIHQEGNYSKPYIKENDEILILNNVRESLVYIVHMLLKNLKDTMGWSNKGRTNPKDCSLVVLRLVLILCLLYLNFGECGNLLFQLMGSREIRYHLPREFYDVLRRGWKHNSQNVNVKLIADALKKIGNPLVIVSFGRNSSEAVCASAISIDMKASQREEILGTLFPELKDTQSHVVAAKPDALPPASSLGKHSDVACSNASSALDLDFNTDLIADQAIGEDDLKMKLGLLWKMVGALCSMEDDKDLESAILHTPIIKVSFLKLFASDQGMRKDKHFNKPFVAVFF